MCSALFSFVLYLPCPGIACAFRIPTKDQSVAQVDAGMQWPVWTGHLCQLPCRLTSLQSKDVRPPRWPRREMICTVGSDQTCVDFLTSKWRRRWLLQGLLAGLNRACTGSTVVCGNEGQVADWLPHKALLSTALCIGILVVWWLSQLPRRERRGRSVPADAIAYLQHPYLLCGHSDISVSHWLGEPSCLVAARLGDPDPTGGGEQPSMWPARFRSIYGPPRAAISNASSDACLHFRGNLFDPVSAFHVVSARAFCHQPMLKASCLLPAAVLTRWLWLSGPVCAPFLR